MLPAGLVPLGLVSLSDELRPKVQDTLRQFSEAGIKVKVISGDNPQTVAALARQAGLGENISVVSGLELAGMSDADLGQAAIDHNVFGRVTPEQKERLVGALRRRGHYVAMIGDGVNDVISLKKANVAIAMQGGSQAARGVADMVLLKDSFGALPWAFREGQRVFNAMTDILRVFIVRIFTKALLIVGIAAIGGWAFQPRQTSLLSFFAAGLPAIVFAIFAKPGAQRHGDFMGRLGRFVVPASMLMALLGTCSTPSTPSPPSHPFVTNHPGGTAAQVGPAMYSAQTVLTVFLVFCMLLLLPLIVPPTPFWTGGSPLRKDWKPAILSFLMFFGFMAVALSQPWAAPPSTWTCSTGRTTSSAARRPSPGCSARATCGASASWTSSSASTTRRRSPSIPPPRPDRARSAATAGRDGLRLLSGPRGHTHMRGV